MIVYQTEPNFTVILPGPCQARCEFCIEPEGPSPDSAKHWLSHLRTVVADLPPPFRIVSISGGEPTLSPVLLPALEILKASGRFQRVVLTTNGHFKNTMRHMDALTKVVTHVNLSRHAANDIDHRTIFKTNHVPDKSQTREIIEAFNKSGIPVNLNCCQTTS